MICWPAAERCGAVVVHRLRVAASAVRGHSLQLLKFYGALLTRAHHRRSAIKYKKSNQTKVEYKVLNDDSKK